MDLQKMVDAMSQISQQERSKYHLTFGDLIDKLKEADDSLQLVPKVVGVDSYRGYYSDIVLCTESGTTRVYKNDEDFSGPYSSDNWNEWYKENTVGFDFSGTPRELGEKLESLLGLYFEGYKGGKYQITREKPLWLARDSSSCSDQAVVEITNKLEITTKDTD